LAILLTLGLLVGGYRWRVSGIQRRNRELATQVAARTGELAASNEQPRTAKEATEAVIQVHRAGRGDRPGERVLPPDVGLRRALRLTFEVADTGAGIAAAELAGLFQLFPPVRHRPEGGGRHRAGTGHHSVGCRTNFDRHR